MIFSSKSRTPGRMAPNTALCFSLCGAALALSSRAYHHTHARFAVGIGGASVVALGLLALIGYLSGVEHAYGWGRLTRMAVHTSVGFIFVGSALLLLASRTAAPTDLRQAPWMPLSAGLILFTVEVGMWNALSSHDGSTESALPELALLSGIAVAILVTVVLRQGQKALRRAVELERTNQRLYREMAERQQIETEKEQLNNELLQSQKMEAMGTLAGGIAHDFNNILTAIVGFGELAAEMTQPSSPMQEYVQQILTASDRAQSLVDQILTFSRRKDSQKKPILICDVAGEVTELLRASIPSTIEIDYVLDDSGIVMAEEAQIHQLLLNLGSNAARAMEESGGKLTISTSDIEVDSTLANSHSDLSPGSYVRVSVEDTGCGIPLEIQEKIFDPFFTTRASHEGTGLGLSIVYGIVRSHSGVITVDSTPQVGTKMVVFLPSTSRPTDKASDGGTESTTAQWPTGTERVLFVDDDQTQRQLAARLLSRLGYTATVEADGQAALELFESDPQAFDVVITDTTMPRLTGDKLSERLLAIRPDLPIILCTGYSSPKSSANIDEIDIRGFLHKPFRVAELATKIREVLEPPKK